MALAAEQSEKPQRVFVIDPSLQDLRGHHYMMTSGVARSAKEAGFEVIWLVAKEFKSGLNHEGFQVDPVFGASMYKNYLEARERSLNAARTPVGRIFRRLFGSINPTSDCLSTSFADDFLIAVERHSIGAEDRVLLHTADGAAYPAVKLLFEKMPKDKFPSFHVATPYDPVGVMPNNKSGNAVNEAVAFLDRAGAIGTNIFLYAENDRLATHLAQLWDVSVGVLPVPVEGISEELKKAGTEYRHNVLRVADEQLLIISLGSARLEKGFDLMPEIIRHVQSSDAVAQPIRFVLHSSPQIVGRHPEIEKTLGELSAMDGNAVTLLTETISNEDYYKLLYAADCVLLPYDQSAYRVRSSGVVSEAVAAGKVVIAKTGSYPGDVARMYGGKTGRDAYELAQSILTVAANLKSCRMAMADAAEKFLESNDVSIYWKRCLEAEARDTVN